MLSNSFMVVSQTGLVENVGKLFATLDSSPRQPCQVKSRGRSSYSNCLRLSSKYVGTAACLSVGIGLLS